MIEEQVTVLKGAHQRREGAQKGRRLCAARESRAGGEVLNPAGGLEALDDLCRAVAEVLVSVQDPDPRDQTLRLEDSGGDHQAIEAAIVCCACPAGVVKAGAGCGDRRTLDHGGPPGGEHRAGRIGEAPGHGQLAVAEAIWDLASEQGPNEAWFMRQAQLLGRRRRGASEVERQPCF